MKKNNISTKDVIVLIVIALIAILGTIMLAQKTKEWNNKDEIKGIIVKEENEKGEEIKTKIQYVENRNEPISSMLNTYWTNNLKIEEMVDTSGEMIKNENSWVKEYYPLEIRYLQIDGLKDATTEARVNEELKSRAYELVNASEKFQKVEVEVEGNSMQP